MLFNLPVWTRIPSYPFITPSDSRVIEITLSKSVARTHALQKLPVKVRSLEVMEVVTPQKMQNIISLHACDTAVHERVGPGTYDRGQGRR